MFYYRAMSDAATSIFTLEFPYKRSLGPVVSEFLTGLRDGRILGIKDGSGRVIVPPLEYDPETAESLSEFVEVADSGEVVAWAWVEAPMRNHPLDKPFAWALIKLDGADTPMVHAVDSGTKEAMRSGLRVKARWRQERTGHITDIEAFELEATE